MKQLAGHIVDSKAGHFSPDKFEDHYEAALISLLRSKQKGLPVKPQPTHKQANVINLMDALRRSVEGAKGDTERQSKKPTAKARTSRAKSKTRKAG